MFNEKDQLAVDSIRALSIDAIEAANSGHPGLPMGAAPMAYALWTKHLFYLLVMVLHYYIVYYTFQVV